MLKEVDFSSLNTIGTFDDGDDKWSPSVLDDEVLQDYKVHFGLVEMLVSQFCELIEKDPKRKKELYLRLCQLLHTVGFVGPYYALDGFEFVRNYFKESFFAMVKEAQASLGSIPGQSPLELKLSTFKNSFPDSFQYQRYLNDFDEMTLIDKGGFGAVYKSRNKLDGEVYAVKKVYLNYQDILYFLKAVREVRLLAKLKHPNIVAYKASWVEPVTTNKKAPAIQMSKETAREDSLEIEFEIASEEKLHSEKVTSSSLSNQYKSDSSKVTFERSVNYASSINYQETSDSKEIPSENSVSYSSSMEGSSQGEYDSEEMSSSSIKKKIVDAIVKVQNNFPFIKEQAILYVQMELCQQTLRQWLDARNERNEIDMLSCFDIFKQVVMSVDYIHSKGIVHHDLKPSNIFVSHDLKSVQVGDFGLACHLVLHNGGPMSVIPLTEHADVGTKLYAAPEQQRGICHQKSDIYSLGIILLELMQPFRTSMERSKAIEELKRGNMSSSLTIPFVATLLRETMLINVNKRPSSKELLSMIEEFELSKSDVVVIKKQELLNLRTELDTLRKEVEQLRTQKIK